MLIASIGKQFGDGFTSHLSIGGATDHLEMAVAAWSLIPTMKVINPCITYNIKINLTSLILQAEGADKQGILASPYFPILS